jgi:hypothetical protein
MRRPFFPHTLQDVVHHVDGPLGVIVGDLPDHTIWVLTRLRRSPGYTLVHYADAKRSAVLETRQFADRIAAIDAMAAAIGLDERLD